MLPSHSEPSAPPGTEINDLALSITRWCAGSLANATLQIGLSCFLHGTLTSMVMVATFLLLRKGLQNISVQILFPSTLLLYMSTTLYMVAEIWYIYSLHLMASGSADGIKSASYGTSGLVAFEAALHKQSWMFTSAVGVNVILGDGIVWWCNGSFIILSYLHS
ncbi:hypothetical protein BD310DRAFT_79450 [Dichomitus squalens]|uniref:Uncharacterized protein n=1 Tax=Dichomitus squalens TaxID=114155 RepID=A0A4Q9PJV7_9APHY|nr:hypothetical protein BD310DRAFT_79450 [Dichomitus squalens]